MEKVITENQKLSIKNRLIMMVKNDGWQQASDTVGGGRFLLKLAFNNNPTEFLHLFNNLEVIQSEEIHDWTLFRCKKGENLMIYDKGMKYIFINSDKIWSFFDHGLGFHKDMIRKLIEKWLGDIYNLNGVMAGFLDIDFLIRIE